MAKEKKHAFVICEIGWEYNDENYYRPESQGVTPKKIYMDAAEALKECRRLNAAGDGSMEDDRGNVLQQYEVVEVEVA